MRIRIMTFHTPKNYGAVLQGYSLMSYLEKYTEDVKVIDFNTPHLRSLYRITPKISGIKSFIKSILLLPTYSAKRKKYIKFEEFINSETPVLVDYFATWCGPCKMMHPILDELKERLGDKVRILKIDVDVPANRQSVYAYQIQSVPTLMLFKKGRMLWRQSGVVRVPRLEEIIKPYLAS